MQEPKRYYDYFPLFRLENPTRVLYDINVMLDYVVEVEIKNFQLFSFSKLYRCLNYNGITPKLKEYNGPQIDYPVSFRKIRTKTIINTFEEYQMIFQRSFDYFKNESSVLVCAEKLFKSLNERDRQKVCDFISSINVSFGRYIHYNVLLYFYDLYNDPLIQKIENIFNNFYIENRRDFKVFDWYHFRLPTDKELYLEVNMLGFQDYYDWFSNFFAEEKYLMFNRRKKIDPPIFSYVNIVLDIAQKNNGSFFVSQLYKEKLNKDYFFNVNKYPILWEFFRHCERFECNEDYYTKYIINRITRKLFPLQKRYETNAFLTLLKLGFENKVHTLVTREEYENRAATVIQNWWLRIKYSPDNKKFMKQLTKRFEENYKKLCGK
ncbi:hypothetical protein [Diatraea saccharalis granulovirus]|uniref:Uncharacterized protein n=1 Tax=Diatraea saccharalis granulovirus TaxID=1675862 RepID=A0A0R7EZ19_9BBAC|nr:hypothetical protein [Diatraea saccharalis granulovirus]AKN80815.1 hypothetical protein [Diatraea saccharalis granulovirus]